MKKQLFILTLLGLFMSFASFAQSKTDTIKVWGNCGSCKEHIEDAATAAGATKAVWDKNTKILVVTYDAATLTNMAIQQKIAAAGYDTQDVKADNAAYNKLDKCCQYKRKKSA